MYRIISIALAALIAAVLVPVAASGSSDRSSSRDGSRSSGTAGTVKSYADGVLTIALKDGTEVSGKVTRKTDIECDGDRRSARSSSRGDDDKSGDDKGRHRGDDRNKGKRGDERSDGKRRGGRDDCGDQALVEGADVHKAKLKISSRGLTWDDVELRS